MHRQEAMQTHSCPFKTPKKKKSAPRKAVDTTWKPIYKQAYFDYQLSKLGAKAIEEIGYVQITSYPNVNTHKGFEQAVENYVKWKGGFAQNTPTIGTPRFKEAMVGGKLVKEQAGWMNSKGGRGKQDIDLIIAGVNVKVELKCEGDEQKKEQAKYQRRVQEAGGVYIILRSMHELYEIVDMCLAGKSLKQVKFHEK